jgi:tetratricopeptide (TPR) repeat protein
VLEELRARIGASPDEDVFDALDRVAPDVLRAGRADLLFVGCLDEAEGALPPGRPWSALVVANAIYDLRSRRDAVCTRLIDVAEQEFRATNDRDGLGTVAFVRGMHAMGHGDLELAGRYWKTARELLGDRGMQHQTLASLALDAYQRGELAHAALAAEEAIALARLGHDARGEAVALTYLGFVCINTGELARAESVIAAAESRFRSVPDEAERVELPIVLGERGIVACLRGQPLVARASFADAVAFAERIKVPWFVAVVRAARAEFSDAVPLDERDADAHEALEIFTSMGDEWFGTWGMRAIAVIARERGDLDVSERILRDLVPRTVGPCETGLALLRLGETCIVAKKTIEAREALHEAIDLFDSCGSRHWRAWAQMCVDRIDGRNTAKLTANVRSMSDDARARAYLLERFARLEIKMLGTPSISFDGVPLTFRTERAELLLYALALAPRGLHPDELGERLWPDSDAGRIGSRLRTALWEARRMLGDASWRLQRERGLVRLDLEGARVDLRAASAAADEVLSCELRDAFAVAYARRVADELSRPLLPAWSYEEWVHEADQVRAQQHAQVLAWLDAPA